MKTKIKPFTLRTYIKEVKNTVTNTVLLDQIPKDFDFSKVTDLQIASVAEIRAKMEAINGTIVINSAANLENQEAVGEFDFWGKFGTPKNLDFGFDYYTTPMNGDPETICNAADMSQQLGVVHTIYQDNNPEEVQLPEEQFLAKVKEVMMIALSEDGKLRLIGSSGADCNDLVTLVTEDKIHTKGIYFRGADGQEHKLNQDLPELAELEEILTPDEQHSSSNVIIYVAEHSDGSITGIVGSPSLEEIRQNILNGAQIWLQLDDNAEPVQYLKLVTTAADAAYFMQLYVSGNNNLSGCYIYGDRGDLRYQSFTNSSGK